MPPPMLCSLHTWLFKSKSGRSWTNTIRHWKIQKQIIHTEIKKVSLDDMMEEKHTYHVNKPTLTPATHTNPTTIANLRETQNKKIEPKSISCKESNDKELKETNKQQNIEQIKNQIIFDNDKTNDTYIPFESMDLAKKLRKKLKGHMSLQIQSIAIPEIIELRETEPISGSIIQGFLVFSVFFYFFCVCLFVCYLVVMACIVTAYKTHTQIMFVFFVCLFVLCLYLHCIAPMGTGKTLAYLIPIFDFIEIQKENEIENPRINVICVPSMFVFFVFFLFF